jgi:hypothetical protein
MNKNKSENRIMNNSGETLVEVMVAFVVLMLVLAMFTASVNAASASITNSIDIRRTSDNDYIGLRKILAQEDCENTPVAFNGNPGSETAGRTGVTSGDNITVTGTDNSNITINAVQYRSGDTVYWVFR